MSIANGIIKIKSHMHEDVSWECICEYYFMSFSSQAMSLKSTAQKKKKYCEKSVELNDYPIF